MKCQGARCWANIVEFVLMCTAVALTFALTSDVSWAPELRWLLGYCAVVVFAQGLIRDLARLALRRRAHAKVETLRCLCAESSLGLVLLVLGAGGLTLLGITQTVALSQASLTLLLAGLLVLGFVSRDYVIALRRVEDHAAIDVW